MTTVKEFFLHGGSIKLEGHWDEVNVTFMAPPSSIPMRLPSAIIDPAILEGENPLQKLLDVAVLAWEQGVRG